MRAAWRPSRSLWLRTDSCLPADYLCGGLPGLRCYAIATARYSLSAFDRLRRPPPRERSVGGGLRKRTSVTGDFVFAALTADSCLLTTQDSGKGGEKEAAEKVDLVFVPPSGPFFYLSPSACRSLVRINLDHTKWRWERISIWIKLFAARYLSTTSTAATNKSKANKTCPLCV